MKEHTLPVFRGTYKASGFNSSTSSFDEVPSVLSCNTDYNLTHDEIDSCFLTVQFPVEAREISLIKLEYSKTAQDTRQLIKITDTI